MKGIKVTLIISLVFNSLFLMGQNSEVENLVKEGIELHDIGEYKKAIEVYKKALDLDPKSGLVNYEIAFSYFSDHNYKNAEKHSKKVIDQKGDHLLPAYITYGNALDMQGKTKKAIKVFEKAMKDFDNYMLYYNHAITCYNAGENDKAYDSAIKAISNNSSHASSHLVLSKIMEKEGVRIKAMLPLYFFLLIEPNSDRAAVEYKNLRGFIDFGVSKESEKKINVEVPMNGDPDFGAAEMMISLSRAANNVEENKGKTDLELFSDNNESLFKILGELKNDNSGFWWDFYVPFFNDLANADLAKSYSYYISLSKGEEAVSWIDENSEEFEKFKNWLNK
ncbi:MAG: tetratricopeptide repeat protein [Bacteroidota bacterium]